MPGMSLMQKLRRLITGPVPLVAEHRAQCPDEVNDLVKKLMSRNPAERYQTPADLIEAIDAILKAKVKSGRRGSSPATPVAPASAVDAHQVLSTSPTVAHSADAHPGGVRSLSLSADGKLLLSGGQDETLRSWDPASFAELRCIAGDVGPVEDACLCPSGKWAASCALRLFKSDMVVQLWEMASGRTTPPAQRSRRHGLLRGDLAPTAGASRPAAATSPFSSGRSISQARRPSASRGTRPRFPASCSCLRETPLLSGSHDGTVCRVRPRRICSIGGLLHWVPAAASLGSCAGSMRGAQR